MTPESLRALAGELRAVAEPAVTVVMASRSGRWRVGRKIRRTLYVQNMDEPSDADPFIGLMDRPQDAEYIASVDPQTALKIADALDQAAERIEGLEKLIDALPCFCSDQLIVRLGKCPVCQVKALAALDMETQKRAAVGTIGLSENMVVLPLDTEEIDG